VEQARAATGWALVVDHNLTTTEPPTERELAVLRRLKASTEASYDG
jgi:glutaconate CoA-transferase subunit B